MIMWSKGQWEALKKKDMGGDLIDLLRHQTDTWTTTPNHPSGLIRWKSRWFWWKCQLPDSLKIFLMWKPFRQTIEYLKCVKKKCISIMLKLFIVCMKKSEFSLRIFRKCWTLVFDGSDNFQITGKFVNYPYIPRKS